MTFELTIALIAAPFIGSFLGLVIDRLPSGRPIVVDRSVCDQCGKTLGWRDLLPLVSFLLQSGRCRHCGQALSTFYPMIELAAVAVVICATLMPPGWLFWCSLLLGWCLLVLAVIDLRHLILPDVLTLPLIPIGLLVAYVISPGLVGDHVIGVAVGLIAFAGIGWLYRRLREREGLGLGDAKLLAGAGAWLGWAALPGVVLMAACSALVTALIGQVIERQSAVTREIAFGPHLALAFWLSWLFGPLAFGY
jgi:leader peptidase (prepilin peptidase)/N-methyltransferase